MTPSSSEPLPDSVAALPFEDEHAVTDLDRFAHRAKTMGAVGMRFQVFRSVLATWVSILAPHGLGDKVPVVMGLRTQRLRQLTDDTGAEANHWDGFDMVFDLDAVTDRTARMLSTADTNFALPPVQLSVSWTAISPPRQGWQANAEIADQELRHVAEAGIRELAEALPEQPGEAMVNQARAGVWGRNIGDEAVVTLPAGVAFVAHGLGFLRPEGTTMVHSQGPWRRLSTAGGFVVARQPTAL